jgi:hypothetical protein
VTKEPILATVPSLDEIAADPARASALPAQAVEALLAASHMAQGALLGRLLALRAPTSEGSSVDHEAVGIEQAAKVLGMRLSTLYRKWRALGIGYKDTDGHVKFTRVALRRYIARKGG